MISVIFEVLPNIEKRNNCSNRAAEFRPAHQNIPGFISIERVQNLTNPDKLLPLSFWENEVSLKNGRNVELCLSAPIESRLIIFNDYHLRIAEVFGNYRMNHRDKDAEDKNETLDRNEQR